MADTYGRGVALSRMKEALEKGFEGLKVELLPRLILTQTKTHTSERSNTAAKFGDYVLVST